MVAGRRSWRVGAALPALVFASIAIGACSFSTDLSGYSGGAAAPTESDAALAADTDVVEANANPDAGADAGADASACPDGFAGAACDFTLVLGLDIPATADWDTVADVPYALDNTAKVASFTRVAYRLVLDSQELWVELDAFTADPARLGVPVDWIFKEPVTNVTVRAVSPNQGDVVVPTAGNLEFWSNCYQEGVDGAFDDDDVVTANDCHGSMQIHVAGQVIFAFNGWSRDMTTPVSLGIGRFPNAARLDWTFAENGNDLVKRGLEVYVR
jgi:hypothetical protein